MKKATLGQPQEELSKIEERYRTLFKHAEVGMYESKIDGSGILAVNRKLCEITGYTEEEMLSSSPALLWVNPEARNEMIAMLKKRGILINHEVEIKTKSNEVRTCSISVRLFQDQGILEGTVLDITDRKRGEKELQRKSNVDKALAALYPPLISPSSTMKDITLIIKFHAQQLTDSEHCYVVIVNRENKDVVAYTLTEMMKNGQCAIAQKENHRTVFQMDHDGKYGSLWGHSLNTREGFYTNDVQNHSESRGEPEGHIKIVKFLSIPVMLEKQLVGQISLANPSRDYTDQDLITISRLAEFFALAIQKLRFEESFRARSEELEKFNQSMVNREMRIIELKKEINKLSEELSRPIRFPEFWKQKEN
ncbi:MAG: GAF domain-containing protein [Bacteroidia bacterium]|nr:GAF domain-containing protein [Bacteroidia bacterium]